MTVDAPPDRAGEVVRGGRRIGWTEWGARDGTPVLYCTGAGMAGSFGFGADAARELGVRLVCVDRAGLGRSQPDPAKSFATWTADVAAALHAAGVVAPPVVGFSQGAPFAAALAGAGVASRLAIVAGTDELVHPAIRARLVPDVAAMVRDIEADPAGFEAAFAHVVDADGLWRLVVAMSAPHDRARYEEPAFAAAYRRALAEGFAQGPGGYVRDVVLASGPWPTPPERIAVPVTLWYGALDTSPVHSPDAGATLAARFPRATRHVLPDEGGSILWTRAREILRDLLAPA